MDGRAAGFLNYDRRASLSGVHISMARFISEGPFSEHLNVRRSHVPDSRAVQIQFFSSCSLGPSYCIGFTTHFGWPDDASRAIWLEIGGGSRCFHWTIGIASGYSFLRAIERKDLFGGLAISFWHDILNTLVREDIELLVSANACFMCCRGEVSRLGCLLIDVLFKDVLRIESLL